MKHFKTIMLLSATGAFFSCQRTAPADKIPIESAVWYTVKCTDGLNEEVLCPYSFLRLYKNGRFAAGALRGFSTGNWKKDTTLKQVYLFPDTTSAESEQTPTLLQISYHSDRYLNALMARDESDLTNGNLQLLRMRPGKTAPADDPFTADMHKWRLKPEREETMEEIKARTVGYLRFLEKFFGFAAQNHIEEPDTDWFPNVMKLDNPSSVRLTYTNELKDWYACFYNEAQAIEGYKIISGPFTKITLKKMEDLNERNLDVLKQILVQIK